MTVRGRTAGDSIIGLSGPGLREAIEPFLAGGLSCRLMVRGSSMTPFIRSGDVAVIEPLRGQVSVGDVVAAAAAGGGFVVHRIVSRRRATGVTMFLLSGDSGCGGDEWVESSMVLGRVRFVSRGHRRIRVGGGFAGRAASALSRKLCAWRRRRACQ